MNNQYAVWSGKDDRKFFNPIFKAWPILAGDVIDGFECVFVGDLEECLELVGESTEVFSWDGMESLS